MSGTIPHHQNSGSIDPEALSLVADIGATNARFALAVSGSNELIKPLTLLTNNFTSILSACREYFNHIADLHPSRACIAVACPISGDHVSLTNNSWTFSIEEVRQKLNVGRLMVVNDFKAMAAGVPHLAAEEIDQICVRSILRTLYETSFLFLSPYPTIVYFCFNPLPTGGP